MPFQLMRVRGPARPKVASWSSVTHGGRGTLYHLPVVQRFSYSPGEVFFPLGADCIGKRDVASSGDCLRKYSAFHTHCWGSWWQMRIISEELEPTLCPLSLLPSLFSFLPGIRTGLILGSTRIKCLPVNICGRQAFTFLEGMHFCVFAWFKLLKLKMAVEGKVET